MSKFDRFALIPEDTQTMDMAVKCECCDTMTTPQVCSNSHDRLCVYCEACCKMMTGRRPAEKKAES